MHRFALKILTLCAQSNFTFFSSTIVCKDLPVHCLSSLQIRSAVRTLLGVDQQGIGTFARPYKQAYGKDTLRKLSPHMVEERKANENLREKKKSQNWIFVFAKKCLPRPTQKEGIKGIKMKRKGSSFSSCNSIL